MTCAQSKAARRRILNDPRYARRRRRDPAALERKSQKQLDRQKAMAGRKPKTVKSPK